MSNVAISYCRVSTKEQSDSLPVQQRKCLDYAENKQLQHDQTFVDSQSGRTDDRPKLQALLEYCSKHRKEVKHVIVSDLSRLARNVTDQGLIIAELTSLGIRLHSVDESSLGDDATGKLGRNVIGAISQFFSDSLSERTKYRMQSGRRRVASFGLLRSVTSIRRKDEVPSYRLILPACPSRTQGL